MDAGEYQRAAELARQWRQGTGGGDGVVRRAMGRPAADNEPAAGTFAAAVAVLAMSTLVYGGALAWLLRTMDFFDEFGVGWTLAFAAALVVGSLAVVSIVAAAAGLTAAGLAGSSAGPIRSLPVRAGAAVLAPGLVALPLMTLAAVVARQHAVMGASVLILVFPLALLGPMAGFRFFTGASRGASAVFGVLVIALNFALRLAAASLYS